MPYVHINHNSTTLCMTIPWVPPSRGFYSIIQCSRVESRELSAATQRASGASHRKALSPSPCLRGLAPSCNGRFLHACAWPLDAGAPTSRRRVLLARQNFYASWEKPATSLCGQGTVACGELRGRQAQATL